MADLSRRALVGALPTVAVPAVALPAAIVGGVAVSNLSRLLDIESVLKRIEADIDATYPANVAAFREWNRLRKGWSIPRLQDDTPRAFHRHVRAKARWERRLEQARADAGLVATEKRLRDLRDDRDDLVGSVWSIPATDLATLQVKARMGQVHTNLLGSTAADVLALTAL